MGLIRDTGSTLRGEISLEALGNMMTDCHSLQIFGDVAQSRADRAVERIGRFGRALVVWPLLLLRQEA